MSKSRHVYRTDSADAEPDEDGTVLRFDRGELLRPTVREDGTLLVAGRAARPGVLLYRTANGGTRRELVLPEDLHKADSLATLGRAPVTLEHPNTEVNPDNVGQVGVGDVDGEVFVEEDGFVTVRMAVRRRDAIDAIHAGKVELSPGYRVRIEETAGVHPEFGRFDAIQRDRRYNHLAIVDNARGGESVRLRTDGAAYELPDPHDPGGSTVRNPLLISLLALLDVPRTDSEDADLTVAATRADALLTASVDLGQMAGKIDTLTASLDAMTGERDALQTQVDAHKNAEEEKHDAAELLRLDGFRETLKLEAVKGEERPALLRRIATHFDSDLAEDASDQYMHGIVKIGMAVAVDKRADSGKAWGGLKIDSKQVRIDADDDDSENREDSVKPSTAQINQYATAFAARGE